MKKLALVLVLILALAIPVLAGELTGQVETGFEYAMPGELVDITEVSVETAVNDTTTAKVILTVEELLFGSGLVVDAEGKLQFAIDEGETAEVGAKVDVLTGDVRLRGKYLGLTFADDFALNSYAEYKYDVDDVNSYHIVSTLIYDYDEDLDVLVEGRVDSDGMDATLSAEIQATYAVNEDTDVTVGYEINDWSDNINDWGDYDIVSDTDTVYAKVVVRF